MVSKLDSLFISEKEADSQLIAELLDPYLRIGKDTGIIIPNDKFSKITIKNKILLYCVGRKAAKLKGVLKENEGIKPDRLVSVLGASKKVVSVTTSRLKKKGLLDKDKSGYFISIPKLTNVKMELEAGHKTHKRYKTRKQNKK